MATDFAADELSHGPAMAAAAAAAALPRQIRLAKPEEGEARGEVFHLVRALGLVIGATALIGWLVS